MFSLDQTLTLKSFTVTYWWFFDRTNLFKSKERLFQQLKSSLEVQRAKRKFSDNHGHNILGLDNVLIQTRLTTNKTKRNIQYTKLGITIASRVTKRLKTQDLTKSRNAKKILNLCGDIAQCPVSLPEINVWQQQ